MPIKTSSAKAKGRRLQQWVAHQVRELFGLSENDVVPTPMGVSGIDVQLSDHARSFFPFAVECKSYAKLAIYAFWKQAQDNRGTLTPLLVVKADRQEPLVIISWDTFQRFIDPKGSVSTEEA